MMPTKLHCRATGSQVESVHIKRPQPFRWLRRLFRLLKFKHARFDDGKYTRECKDVDKWRDGCAITEADHPDHRCQAGSKWRSCRRGGSPQDSVSQDQNGEISPIHGHVPTCRYRDIIVHRKYEERMARKRYADLRNASPSGGEGDMTVPGGLRSSTVEADIHCGRHHQRKPKDKVRDTLRQVEAGVREQLSGYVPLEQGTRTDQGDIPATRRRWGTTPAPVVPHPGGGRTSSPVRYTVISLPPDSPTPQPWANTHDTPDVDTTPSNKVCDKNAHNVHCPTDIFSGMDNMNEIEHENDNDANHLRAVKSVRPVNKKPKGRKSKRRKVRRKGKYKELLPAPSEEALEVVETEDDSEVTSVQQRAKCNKRVKKKGKTFGRRIREVEAGLKTLRFEAPIPILHAFTHRRHYTRLH